MDITYGELLELAQHDVKLGSVMTQINEFPYAELTDLTPDDKLRWDNLQSERDTLVKALLD